MIDKNYNLLLLLFLESTPNLVLGLLLFYAHRTFRVWNWTWVNHVQGKWPPHCSLSSPKVNTIFMQFVPINDLLLPKGKIVGEIAESKQVSKINIHNIEKSVPHVYDLICWECNIFNNLCENQLIGNWNRTKGEEGLSVISSCVDESIFSCLQIWTLMILSFCTQTETYPIESWFSTFKLGQEPQHWLSWASCLYTKDHGLFYLHSWMNPFYTLTQTK